MDEVEALVAALRAQQALVERLPPVALSTVTACEGWSVRDVVNHSLAVTAKLTEFAAGRTDRPRQDDRDRVGDDAVAAVRTVVAEAIGAWAAVDRRRVCTLGFGTFTVEETAGVNLFDCLAHTWDVASATGSAVDVPDEVWECALAAAVGAVGEDRDRAHYGPVVDIAPDSGARERFLAFLGRSRGPAVRADAALGPRLVELTVGDTASTWAGLGFDVRGDRVRLGDVDVVLTGGGGGVLGWSLAGVGDVTSLVEEGLAATVVGGGAEPAAGAHPNGVASVDHVVVATPDLDRTVTVLGRAGFALRRRRDAGKVVQAFFRLGDKGGPVLEVVGGPAPTGDGPASFWGLALTGDVDLAAVAMGDLLGAPRDAVQPGRRIATVRRGAGSSVPLAILTPRLSSSRRPR